MDYMYDTKVCNGFVEMYVDCTNICSLIISPVSLFCPVVGDKIDIKRVFIANKRRQTNGQTNGYEYAF